MMDGKRMNIALLYGTAYAPDDALLALAESLTNKGHNVSLEIWADKNVKWDSYDAIIIRSKWDYFLELDAYRDWLLEMKAAKRPLYNSADLVLWNLEKTYLLDLESRGVPIVPTCLVKQGDDAAEAIKKSLSQWAEAPYFIIKPTVSAGAYETRRIARTDMDDAGLAAISAVHAHSDALVQPYMAEIEEGEYALVFLNGAFAYAVHKKPVLGDFRVQTKHGGILTPVDVDAQMVAAGKKVIDVLEDTPLYARVDGVVRDGQFLLMELEINEPGLYDEIFTPGTDMIANVIDKIAA